MDESKNQPARLKLVWVNEDFDEDLNASTSQRSAPLLSFSNWYARNGGTDFPHWYTADLVMPSKRATFMGDPKCSKTSDVRISEVQHTGLVKVKSTVLKRFYSWGMRSSVQRKPRGHESLAAEPKSIGQMIRKARLERGLTQLALARLIGVTKSAISEWERDQIENLKLKNVTALWLHLRIPPGAFKRDSDGQTVRFIPNNALISGMPLQSNKPDPFAGFYKLSPENQDIIAELIASLPKTG